MQQILAHLREHVWISHVIIVHVVLHVCGCTFGEFILKVSTVLQQWKHNYTFFPVILPADSFGSDLQDIMNFKKISSAFVHPISFLHCAWCRVQLKTTFNQKHRLFIRSYSSKRQRICAGNVIQKQTSQFWGTIGSLILRIVLNWPTPHSYCCYVYQAFRSHAALKQCAIIIIIIIIIKFPVISQDQEVQWSLYNKRLYSEI